MVIYIRSSGFSLYFNKLYFQRYLNGLRYQAAFHDDLWFALGNVSTIMHCLAHRIMVSDILSWDRKSYLTHAILPWLSCESYNIVCIVTHATLSSSDTIVLLK